MNLVTTAKRMFYEAGGPWHRNRLFEAAGSRRYSRPALHEMDRQLEALLPDGPGVFVEAGAHDGYTQSNTYYLERFRGWSGLLVEAVPALQAKARRRRPRSYVAHAALVARDHPDDTVIIRFGDLMSAITDEELPAPLRRRRARRRDYAVRVPARTLSSLLDEAGIDQVDLMVLDVEGHEVDALGGLDFERHAPDLLLIEMLDMPTQRPTFDALLADHYDFDRSLSAWDALYRRRR